MQTTMRLEADYLQLKTTQPKIRIRDAARHLGVSEADLVALQAGKSVMRLQPKWQEILQAVAALGSVMALTRNDDAVHERHGVYNNVSFQGPVGLVVNRDIDLRLFMMHWQYGFAVNEHNRLSLQFFDKSGEAVHKIYCTEATNIEAYHALVHQYKEEEQAPEIVTVSYPPEAPEIADEQINVTAFQAAWKAMKDTHDFYMLLKQFRVGRLQAMRLASEDLAIPLNNHVSVSLLQQAAERAVPIMVFVGNRGCIQIHSGKVNNLMETGPWFNVLDSEFNLHLRHTAIKYTYAVTKPSVDGLIHSIEAFDEKGEMIVQFFGERKPGIPELTTWQALVKDIVDTSTLR